MKLIRPLLAAPVFGFAMIACARTTHHDAESSSARSAQPPAAIAPDTTADRLVASPTGVGPLRIGMSWGEVSHAVGTTLPTPRVADAGCFYAAWPNGPGGVRMMFEAGHVTRIDVDNRDIPTAEGARIGDTEASLLATYRGRSVVSPQKYTDGHSIAVRPLEPADSAYRIVFETDSGRLTRYRVGRLPAVEYVEACG